MKREDFMFTVGFDGATAVVDGAAKRRYARASVGQLLEAGLYRLAACAALWDRDEAAIAQVVTAVNAASGGSLRSSEDLVRLLGVPTQVLKSESQAEAPQVRVQVI